MARPVRIRERYTADRGRLTRLEEAMEKDFRLSESEKSDIRGHLRELVSLFAMIDDRIHSLRAREAPVKQRRKAA